MAFTQADLDTIDRALVDLAAGSRVTSINIGGDVTTFSDGATVRQLQSVRAMIQAELSSTWSPRTYASNGGRG